MIALACIRIKNKRVIDVIVGAMTVCKMIKVCDGVWILDNKTFEKIEFVATIKGPRWLVKALSRLSEERPCEPNVCARVCVYDDNGEIESFTKEES